MAADHGVTAIIENPKTGKRVTLSLNAPDIYGGMWHVTQSEFEKACDEVQTLHQPGRYEIYANRSFRVIDKDGWPVFIYYAR